MLGAHVRSGGKMRDPGNEVADLYLYAVYPATCTDFIPFRDKN